MRTHQFIKGEKMGGLESENQLDSKSVWQYCFSPYWVRVATSNQDLTKTREDEARVRTRGSLRHQRPGLNESELATHWAIQLLKKEAIKPSKVTTRSEKTRETVLGVVCRREPRVLTLAYAVIFSVLHPLLSWLDLGLRLLPLLIHLLSWSASRIIQMVPRSNSVCLSLLGFVWLPLPLIIKQFSPYWDTS